MAEHPLLQDERITAIGLLIEAHDGLLARLRPQLERNGVPQNEFETLLRLARSPGLRLRMHHLAAQLSLSTSGLTRLVDRLERRELVSREACPTDRRGSYAVLTSAGRELVERTLEGHVPLVDQWFTSVLSADELAALTHALRKVRDVVRPDAEAGSADADEAAAVSA